MGLQYTLSLGTGLEYFTKLLAYGKWCSCSWPVGVASKEAASTVWW